MKKVIYNGKIKKVIKQNLSITTLLIEDPNDLHWIIDERMRIINNIDQKYNGLMAYNVYTSRCKDYITGIKKKLKI